MKHFLLLTVLTWLFFPACDLLDGFGDSDSDGDGITDVDEVDTYNFDPDANPFKFNPYIADTPKITFELNSPPSIIINYENTQGETTTATTEWGTESAHTVSTSHTTTEARTMEHSVGATIGASHEFGILGGTTVSASVNYQFTISNEVSNSYTSEQTSENRRTYNESYSYEQSQSYTYQDASLSVALNVVNTGFLAYTIENITLSAVEINPLDPDSVSPICNLNLDISTSSFPETTIGPNQAIENWVFTNTIDLDTAHHLLRDNRNLIIKVASYEIVDDQDRSFTHNMTEINNKTAAVLIDYGVGEEVHAPDKYMVATNASGADATDGITVGSVFSDVMRLPYSTGTCTVNDRDVTVLKSVRDLEVDTATGGWVVTHTYTKLGEKQTDVYSPEESYSFEDILLKPGNILMVVYVEDKDHDGLTAREELLYGTDDSLSDTDGDGIGDAAEIAAGTDPLLTPAEEEETDDGSSDTPGTLSEVANLAVNLDNSSGQKAVLTWSNPTSDTLFRQVLIARAVGEEVDGVPQPSQSYSTGGYITDPDDATKQFKIIYIGDGSSCEDGNLSYGKTYHYKVFTSDMTGGIATQYSDGVTDSIKTDIQVTVTLDDITVVDEGDGSGKCELYWTIKVTSSAGLDYTLDSKARTDHWSTYEGTYNSFSPGTATFTIPQEDDAWFKVDMDIDEDDGGGSADDMIIDEVDTYRVLDEYLVSVEWTWPNWEFTYDWRYWYDSDFGWSNKDVTQTSPDSEDSDVEVHYSISASK